MKKLSIAALAAAVIAAPAAASTQGVLGPTSTGTVTINASVAPEVNIENIDDFDFDANILLTALNTNGFASQSDRICIWSNLPSGEYFLTATGDGPGQAFRLFDGTSSGIEYQPVLIPDGVNPIVTLVSGTKTPAITSAATQPDCAGGTTAELEIVIPSTEIAQMSASTTYTGVITLLVTPS